VFCKNSPTCYYKEGETKGAPICAEYNGEIPQPNANFVKILPSTFIFHYSMPWITPFHAMSEEGYVYRWTPNLDNFVAGQTGLGTDQWQCAYSWTKSEWKGGTYVVQREVDGTLAPVRWKNAVVTYSEGQVAQPTACGVTTDGEPYCEEYQPAVPASTCTVGAGEGYYKTGMPDGRTQGNLNLDRLNTLLKALPKDDQGNTRKAMELFTFIMNLDVANHGFAQAEVTGKARVPGLGSSTEKKYISWLCVIMGDGAHETRCGITGPGWDETPSNLWSETQVNTLEYSRSALVQTPVRDSDAKPMTFFKELSCLETHRDKRGPASCTRCPPGANVTACYTSYLNSSCTYPMQATSPSGLSFPMDQPNSSPSLIPRPTLERAHPNHA